MRHASRLFLDRLAERSGLGAGELATVESCFTDMAAVEKDHDLVRQGRRSDRLHVVAEGWACRYTLLSDGRRQISAIHLSGDLCDIDALKTGSLDFSVVTLSPCRIAYLSRTALNEAMAHHPHIGGAFLDMAIAENRVLARWNLSLGRQIALERMAHFICELVVRTARPGAQQAQTSISFPLNQNELGDVLGLSAVHVNRTLGALRALRLIRLRRDTLQILNWNGLVAAGEFDAGYLGMMQNRRIAPLA